MSGLEWMPDALREAGLVVHETEGWRDRWQRTHANGSPAVLRDPSAPAIVWHHDGSPAGDSPGSLGWITGALDAGEPAAVLWLDFTGEWWIIGNGYASHTGPVLPGMPGNADSIGIETDHTTGEDWPAGQLDSLRRGTAALLRASRQGVDRLHFHKTICDPPGRKPDPYGLELAEERRIVAGLLAGGPLPTTPTTPPTGDDVTPDELRSVLRQEVPELTYTANRRAIQRELGDTAREDPRSALMTGVIPRVVRNVTDLVLPALLDQVGRVVRAVIK